MSYPCRLFWVICQPTPNHLATVSDEEAQPKPEFVDPFSVPTECLFPWQQKESVPEIGKEEEQQQREERRRRRREKRFKKKMKREALALKNEVAALKIRTVSGHQDMNDEVPVFKKEELVVIDSGEVLPVKPDSPGEEEKEEEEDGIVGYLPEGKPTPRAPRTRRRSSVMR